MGKRNYNTRTFPVKKALALLSVTLVFGGIFYFLFLSEHFKIKNVEIKGAKTIQNQEIMSAVEFVLSQRKLGILPLKNFLIFPESKVHASLLESFPKISTVNLKKINPDGLDVIISEREALGIWCGTACFYFDKKGVAFEESPRSVGSLILSIADEREGTYYLGDAVLSGEYAEFLSSVKELVDANFPFAIKKFVIKEGGEIELLTSGSWRILLDKSAASNAAGTFDGAATPELQLSNLKYILDEEIGPRMNELEYIDLRLGNKVYYKYKTY